MKAGSGWIANIPSEDRPIAENDPVGRPGVPWPLPVRIMSDIGLLQRARPRTLADSGCVPHQQVVGVTLVERIPRYERYRQRP
jgi:hypothetical protein